MVINYVCQCLPVTSSYGDMKCKRLWREPFMKCLPLTPLDVLMWHFQKCLIEAVLVPELSVWVSPDTPVAGKLLYHLKTFCHTLHATLKILRRVVVVNSWGHLISPGSCLENHGLSWMKCVSCFSVSCIHRSCCIWKHKLCLPRCAPPVNSIHLVFPRF